MDQPFGICWRAPGISRRRRGQAYARGLTDDGFGIEARPLGGSIQRAVRHTRERQRGLRQLRRQDRHSDFDMGL
jgi:hypothetical protein